MTERNANYAQQGEPLTTVRQLQNMISSHRGDPGCMLATASRELIDWLIARDTHNRKHTPSNVERLKGDIEAGNWYVTNQGIGLTKGQFIVDGGHRLESIRQAGYPPVKFFLMFNIDDKAQAYVDRHHKRHMSDIMSLMHDTAVSKRYVAVLNVMLKMRSNWFSGAVQDPLNISAEWEAKHWGFKAFEDVKKIATIPAPVLAALVDRYVVARDPRIVDFAEQVAQGELLASNDPAYVLRAWLFKTSRLSGGSAIQKERYQKTTAALDAHLSGRQISKLYATHAR